MQHLSYFKEFMLESNGSIASLPPRKERPMVQGIAEILRGVRDLHNRRELAQRQIEEFGREGILFDYAEFLELCGLEAN